jgi:hypothetical protein
VSKHTDGPSQEPDEKPTILIGQLSFGIVMGELVPNKHRGIIVTIVFVSALPFAVFGPIIARSFYENTGKDTKVQAG